MGQRPAGLVSMGAPMPCIAPPAIDVRWTLLPEPLGGFSPSVPTRHPSTLSGIAVTRNGGGRQIFGQPSNGEAVPDSGYTDTGGASRFFPTFRYEAKAPTSERPRVNGTAHPTVKPLDLMRWLVRLVTPPGGTVLEPFAGSGTTVEACIVEGFRCIAIEREDDYLPLITHRLSKPIAPALDLWNLA